MTYDALSPELRDILRRFVAQARPKGFFTVDELNDALGPRDVTVAAIEDAMAYLEDQGVRFKDGPDQERPAEYGPLRLVWSRGSYDPT